MRSLRSGLRSIGRQTRLINGLSTKEIPLRIDGDHPIALYQQLLDDLRRVSALYAEEFEASHLEELVERLRRDVNIRWRKTADLALRGSPIIAPAGVNAAAVLARRLDVQWSPDIISALPRIAGWTHWNDTISRCSIDGRIAGFLLLIDLIVVEDSSSELNGSTEAPNAREVMAINAFRAATRQPYDIEAVISTAVSYYVVCCRNEDSARIWEEDDNLEASALLPP